MELRELMKRIWRKVPTKRNKMRIAMRDAAVDMERDKLGDYLDSLPRENANVAYWKAKQATEKYQKRVDEIYERY